MLRLRASARMMDDYYPVKLLTRAYIMGAGMTEMESSTRLIERFEDDDCDADSRRLKYRVAFWRISIGALCMWTIFPDSVLYDTACESSILLMNAYSAYYYIRNVALIYGLKKFLNNEKNTFARNASRKYSLPLLGYGICAMTAFVRMGSILWKFSNSFKTNKIN